ncbi:hypothetical protein [Thetidibacter halocola]|uniref:Uncharacterized protein n=1 Tax=Thetidibacter halocola TaxID=2827239 RepID=A0A8J8B8E3_9RHOB|nr:hypothetical protein [Thetidibacter halocola]MBS0124669.1 hypothetical protein [Thetidibacter halocola]
MHILLGLILAFVLIAVFANRRTRSCRWREFPQGDVSRWRCIQCGAETTGPKGRKPESCHRDGILDD